MSRIVRRSLEVVVGAGAVAVAVMWLSGWFGERVPPGEVAAEPIEKPANAVEAVVERVVGPAIEWASASLVSARRTVVASRVLARIEEVRVRAGDVVAPGDVVIVLESAEFRARLAQARDALRAARARRELARTEKERFQRLYRKGVATRQRFDEVVANLKAAEADVQRFEANVREAEAQLTYTEIRSPVAGRVIDRLAEPGDTAAPGRPLLRIYDPTALRAEAPVRETLAVRLRVGDGLRVEVPAVAKEVSGTIEEIVPFVEPGARSLLVKVGLPKDPRLFAGMYARVAVPAGKRTRLLLPAGAVERIGQLEFVTVVGAGGRLERRMVTTGERVNDGRIEVLSGLEEGERVIFGAG